MVNLPNSPSVGDQTTILGRTFTWNGTAWQLTPQAAPFTYGPTPPEDPGEGSVWVDSATLRQYWWIDDGDSAQWVELSSSALPYIDTDVLLASNDDSRLVSQKAVKTYIDARLPIPGGLIGLTLSNNGSDATNDIDIAAGQATDSGNTDIMVLASSLTKRLDAAWASGSNAGGLDTGSIANTTYHVFLIKDPTNNLVDALFSTSPTAPTMPGGYTLKRRIGSIKRISAAIKAFHQFGDVFKWDALAVDRNSTNAASVALLTLTVPTGIVVAPIVQQSLYVNGAASDVTNQLGDVAAGSGGVLEVQRTTEASSTIDCNTVVNSEFYTNTSAQLYYACTIQAGAITFNYLSTLGWIDNRGRT